MKQKFLYQSDGTLDITAWLEKIKVSHGQCDISFLSRAAEFAKKLAHGLTTFYGQPCLKQGLEIAEIILDLKLDRETAAAGMISSATSITRPAEEIIQKELGDTIAKLVTSSQQMDVIATRQTQRARDLSQIDKMRKMLLAMAKDIRVVIIKLAERLCFMRGIKDIPSLERKRYAQEILDIYAPLANRLGIGQLKWELEDLAFRYLDPLAYKSLAQFLAERRTDREKRIHEFSTYLQQKLTTAQIAAEVIGRAKHLYSIYLKTQRKDVHYENIYDYNAVRVLVPTLEDCYAALSIVHSLWSPIAKEFDDYIAHPKPNGYRSIHTAVIGEDGKHYEIQIRTHAMHEEAELGIAAHWLYKENKNYPLDDATKITYLRQLLDWHQEIAKNPSSPLAAVLDEQIYVMTPAGDILDLPHGATPLDFAYHIHSELGHRCRGAKINGKMVSLTDTLHTSDKVEILTIPQGGPSRDWLNPGLGYVKTPRARNKINHWFKHQALNQDIATGRQLLERELTRSGLTKTTSLSIIARHFNLKNEDSLLAALGRGNIRLAQILQVIQPKPDEKATALITPSSTKSVHESQGSALVGGSDLLTRFAKCCKPIPGDAIIGYITQGRGISIHKKICNNMKLVSDPERLMQIHWSPQHATLFTTDLKIVAQEQEKVLSDLTALFANEKIQLLRFHSTFNKNQNKTLIIVTLQIQNREELQRLLHRIQQLPAVIEVSRVKG